MDICYFGVIWDLYLYFVELDLLIVRRVRHLFETVRQAPQADLHLVACRAPQLPLGQQVQATGFEARGEIRQPLITGRDVCGQGRHTRLARTGVVDLVIHAVLGSEVGVGYVSRSLPIGRCRDR